MTDFPSLQRTHASDFGGGPVLDVDTIQSLQELGGEDDPGLLLELIDLFLEDAEARVERIRVAAEKSDIDAIGRMAHALKSASANLGARGFSEHCKVLEKVAREGDRSNVGARAEVTLSMYSELRTVLQEFRQEAS